MLSTIRRVLVIPTAYPSSQSPENGIFVEDQARVLSERYDVLVFAQRSIGWRKLLAGQVPSAEGLTTRYGVRLYEQDIFVPATLPLRLALTHRLRRAQAALSTIASDWGKPDMIHAHVVLPAGWVSLQLGRSLGVPVALTEHTGPFAVHLETRSQRHFVRETLSGCSKVLAVSQPLAHQMECVGPALTPEILGNVIRTEFFKPDGDDPECSAGGKPLRLFSVALLQKEKGYEHLIRAMRMLLESGFRDCELRIGGDGQDRARLETLTQDLGLERICRFLGMLTREQVRDEMRRCDAFVLPSLAETFGVVIGEAMACGKPVLATRCGGPESQVTPETGILVQPGSASALADGIRKLATGYAGYFPTAIRDVVVRRFGEAAFLESIARQYHDAVRAWSCGGATPQGRLAP